MEHIVSGTDILDVHPALLRAPGKGPSSVDVLIGEGQEALHIDEL